MALNVSLPAELEHRVREHVASGMYGSASEVIREALRLFEAYRAVEASSLRSLQSDLVRGLLRPLPGPTQALDEQTLAAVRRFKAWVTGEYPVRDVLVYGSRARGTHRPDSDVDVAVILEGDEHRLLETKLEMSDAAYDVLLETGVNISPLPLWRDQWEHPEQYANPALLANIAREGVRVP